MDFILRPNIKITSINKKNKQMDSHCSFNEQLISNLRQNWKAMQRKVKIDLFRYHNHLDSKIIKKEWTKQQDELIYELHNKYGNKWAIIA